MNPVMNHAIQVLKIWILLMIDKGKFKMWYNFSCNEKTTNWLFTVWKVFQIKDCISDSLKLIKSNTAEVRGKIWNDAKHFTCMVSSTLPASLGGSY